MAEADPVLNALLDSYSERVIKARENEAIVADRISLASTMLIRATERGVERFVQRNMPHYANPVRLAARAYCAGLLYLMGEPDANDGHLPTPEVTLDRHIERKGVRYTQVTASLVNVGLKESDIASGASVNPRVVQPDDLIEATTLIQAKLAGEESSTAFIGQIGAWIGEQDMPDNHRQSRHGYAPPEILTGVMRKMFSSLQEPDLLNTSFYSLRFIYAINPTLAEVVTGEPNTSVTELREHLNLPEWLELPVQA